MKVRENMGPSSPYISQTIGNFEINPDAKSHEKYELSNDQKISTPFIFDILQGTVSTPFPRQYFGQIFPSKIIVYRGTVSS